MEELENIENFIKFSIFLGCAKFQISRNLFPDFYKIPTIAVGGNGIEQSFRRKYKNRILRNFAQSWKGMDDDEDMNG